MKKQQFTQYLREERFEDLFNHLGWNDYKGDRLLWQETVDGSQYDFYAVAQLGVTVLKCAVCSIPSSSLYKKLDTRIRQMAHDYLCIYYIPGTMHQMWVVPVNKVDKRDLVSVEYTTEAQAEFLAEKISGFSFPLGVETNVMDVKQKVQQAFIVNSEKLTKNFYTEFKKQHKTFESFILGICDDGDRKWYASIMLDRLMFCYFIQKKGFLNGDPDYLANRLRQVESEEGPDEFYSFYRDFLVHLFREGLNAPNHNTTEFLRRFGIIPYLNGGMFDLHTLERRYPDIKIKDEAFSRLFNFFDQWEWHLDTRITASGRDINPDVLGYIFEQFINDRAQMGAYYTKEDITGYIGRNCILPFLFDSVKEKMPHAFRPDGEVWQFLQLSGDRYIYEAVKKGYSTDWRERIPSNIAVGLDTSKPDLLERRKDWNSRTTEEFALPTEIWRETIERLERCETLLRKIEGGEIADINDFITYNLDIRAFAYDLLAETKDHNLVRHFYHALQRITILDPTCGSGAFLFAAMNILEPLYEVCIIRMQDFNEANNNLFCDELSEISNKYRSNIQYFIYKSIILRNLYGVDIMAEAVEIAKLRLFLKMVAVVDVNMRADNLGLDPLPDIDFNIRCGNTLVGYATERELEKDLVQELTAQEIRGQVNTDMEIVARTYKIFRDAQLRQVVDNDEFKKAKKALTIKLNELNNTLNRLLYNTQATIPYDLWYSRTQPFHWIAEFYEIMQNGGFDVIIGNPPYVEYPSNNVTYSLTHLKTSNCGNLYGNCIERAINIGSQAGRFSFIVPVAITCSRRMDNVISLLKKHSSMLSFANFDDRPGKLFEMIQHLRATIILSDRSNINKCNIFSTKYNRWYSEYRNLLFDKLEYVNTTPFCSSFTIPKFSSNIEMNINTKLQSTHHVIAYTYQNNSPQRMYYRAAGGGYFLLVKNTKSKTFINGHVEEVKAEKALCINPSYNNNAIGAIVSSSLFYWNYISYTDCRNLQKSFIDNFHLFDDIINGCTELVHYGEKLFEDYEKNKYTKNTHYKTTGNDVIYDEYYPKLSKDYIDEIDKVLARHYGFTDEELDFIINYDIKYRMGDELNGNDE